MTNLPIEVRSVEEADISIWELLAVLLRRRWAIVLTTLLAAAAGLAFVTLRDATYTTQTSFQPQGSETGTSQLMSLATQFGISMPMSTEEGSPAFYAELVTSREILYRLASVDYEVEGVGRSSLSALLEIEEPNVGLEMRETIEELRNSVLSVQTGRETGIVTVEVRTKWPSLSFQIARRLLDEVARFNLETRRSQAAAERVFIEERVDSARRALTTAESAMQAFLLANRQFENSPDLTFQHDRLDRDISLRQQVYTTLVQAFEQARISEVRDTPVITVLQPPFEPPPDDRRILLTIALGLVLGGMAGVVIAFVIEAVARPSEGDPGREDLRATWRALVRSLPFGGQRTA